MREFISEYGTYIVSALIILFDLVFFPVLKSKLNAKDKDSALLKVLEKLPDYITEAESLFSVGKSKLAFVLQKVHLDCLSSGTEYNESKITSYIENILTTPNKKQ